MPLLDVREVHKRFGHNEVLKGISLTVEQGEVVAILGPSGSGKSTLLRCINGLEPIQGGEIRLHDDRVSGPGVDLDALRQDVGIVFQSYNLFPHMTVLENITLAPIRVRGLARAEAEERALALLKRIGLDAKAKEYPDRLSGGQQQRVAIVRALAMDPMVLLLDEITSALDPELVAEVLDSLRALPGCLLARMSGSGATCFALFAEPDLAEAAARALPQAWWRWGGGLFGAAGRGAET